MKHLSFHHLFRVLAIYLLLITNTGCHNESDQWLADGRTATIRLNLPILKSVSRVDVAGDENAINHLRVIILAQGAKSINNTYTADQLTGGTIEISGVPVGPVQMYVIANEASLGKDYSNLTALQNDLVDVPEKETRKVLIKDESRTHFPKRGSEFPENGLPMTWMNQSLTIAPPSGTPQNIEVNLVRVVAKLNITMNNALTEPLTITGMSFGKFFGDRLYLFQETSLDVPNDAQYEVKNYTNLAITIPGSSSESLVLYIYPSFAWSNGTQASPYTIGFSTQNNITYRPQAFVNEFGALNAIARNTQVNISATLRTTAHVEIQFNVVDWQENTIDVPSFD